MNSGFITIETHPAHPGHIRILQSSDRPDLPMGDDGGAIRYIARFNDIDAARMHIHETLKRQCEDIDEDRYQAEISAAIAAAEAVELKHERVWIDPTLDDAILSTIDKAVDRSHMRRQWVDRIAQVAVGIAIALLLLMNLL